MRTLAALVIVAACGGTTPEPRGPVHTDPARPVADCPVVVAPPALDEDTVKAQSHAFFAALDQHDTAAIDLVAPAFTLFLDGRVLDRDLLTKSIEKRHARNAPPRTRTWTDETVVIGATSAFYAGEGTEHIPAEGDQAAFDRDGYHTLVWVVDGGAWKIAHYQWQKGGLDAERDLWNDIYSKGTGFETAPNQLLVDAVKGHKPGAALDVMSGQGRNAIYLATKKWKVTGVDISDEGHRIANAAAKKKKVAITTVLADVNTWDPGTAKWDLVAMIYAGADPGLVARLVPSIKPGGLFVLEGFHADSPMANVGGGWKDGQLAALFADGFKIIRDEAVEDIADWGQTKQKLVRFVAEKQ